MPGTRHFCSHRLVVGGVGQVKSSAAAEQPCERSELGGRDSGSTAEGAESGQIRGRQDSTGTGRDLKDDQR